MATPSRTTLWRMRKKGLIFHEGYHEKTMTLPDMHAWEASGGWKDAKEIAQGVWVTRLRPFFLSEKEDLTQEIALRLWELSGHPRFQERAWRWTVAVNVVRSYLDRLHPERLVYVPDLSDVPDTSPLFENEDEILAELRRLAGERTYRLALQGREEQINALREIVWK